MFFYGVAYQKSHSAEYIHYINWLYELEICTYTETRSCLWDLYVFIKRKMCLFL